MPAKICIPIIGPSTAEAVDQVKRACLIGDMVEVRVDLLIDADLPAIMNAATKPVLVTLRSKQQGGGFTGCAHELKAALSSLAGLKPDYLDVEEGIELGGSTDVKLIRSQHHFEGFASNFEELLQASGDFFKIAVHCASGIEALLIAKKMGPDVAAIGMGEDGLLTRILTPVLGGPFTFATLSETERSAPGQPLVSTLKELYRFNDLSPSTALLGVIGDPVKWSRSPRVHNAVFRKAGIDAVYMPIRVPEGRIGDFFQAIEGLPFLGLSVTMPHKQAVLPFAAELAPDAQASLAVNTLVWQKGKCLGANTDGKGALDTIERRLKVRGKRLTILGSGGTACAILYEAIGRGAEVTVLNRTVAKAAQLGKRFHCRYGALEDLPRVRTDVLVQATSIGMGDGPVNEPAFDLRAFRQGTITLDCVSAPPKTSFLQQVEALGGEIISGIEMFSAQAARQLALWFPEVFSPESAMHLVEQEVESEQLRS